MDPPTSTSEEPIYFLTSNICPWWWLSYPYQPFLPISWGIKVLSAYKKCLNQDSVEIKFIISTRVLLTLTQKNAQRRTVWIEIWRTHQFFRKAKHCTWELRRLKSWPNIINKRRRAGNSNGWEDFIEYKWVVLFHHSNLWTVNQLTLTSIPKSLQEADYSTLIQLHLMSKTYDCSTRITRITKFNVILHCNVWQKVNKRNEIKKLDKRP